MQYVDTDLSASDFNLGGAHVILLIVRVDTATCTSAQASQRLL